jgi:hypothetical protein
VKVTLLRNSFDHELLRPSIADRQIKTTYLADITEEFVKKFNKQMDCLHQKQLIIGNVDSIHEEKAGISSINQLKISILHEW